MLTYRGKLNWYNYAVNEGFTLIFPGPELKVGAPAIAVWQWTVDATGAEKANVFYHGVINSVVILETGERQLYFFDDKYYRFQAVFSDDMRSTTVVMSNPSGNRSPPAVLERDYNTPLTQGVVPLYFLGKMNWLTYAKNELFLVIIPAGVAVGRDVLAYWQWTVNDAGKEKANVNYKDIIRTREETAQGDVVTFGQEPDTYYTFNGTISKDGQTFSVNMKNPSGAKGGPFLLQLQV